MGQGRKKEPVALIRAKGNSHYSKEYLEQREASEVKVQRTAIIPPPQLPDMLHDEFRHIAEILDEIGIWSELDADTLSEYLLAKEKRINAEAMYRAALKKGDMDAAMKASVLQDKFFKQCRQSGADLGLSITSRCKLVMPNIETVEPVNRFAKFEK